MDIAFAAPTAISCDKGHFACAVCLERQAGAVSAPAPQYPATSAARQLACEACWLAHNAVTLYSNDALIAYIEDARRRSLAPAVSPDGPDPGLAPVDPATIEFAFVAQNFFDRGLQGTAPAAAAADERTRRWQQTATLVRVDRVVNSALWQVLFF